MCSLLLNVHKYREFPSVLTGPLVAMVVVPPRKSAFKIGHLAVKEEIRPF